MSVEEYAKDYAKDVAKDIARKMLHKGYNVADVAECTGLSSEEVLAIKASENLESYV